MVGIINKADGRSSTTDSFFFVGSMGAGKTTIAHLLGRRLKYPVYDSDQYIESSTGVDIPLIFELEGESGFREREAKALRELTEREQIILSTGGGAILTSENRRLLANKGIVIYLQISPEEQYRRLKGDRSRPLIQTTDPLERLKELALERNALYQEVADITIKVDGRTPTEILEILLSKIHKFDKLALRDHKSIN